VVNIAKFKTDNKKIPASQKEAGKTSFKRYKGCFVVRVAGENEYKELENNPLNPFNCLSPEERMEEIIDLLSEIWESNCKEKVMR